MALLLCLPAGLPHPRCLSGTHLPLTPPKPPQACRIAKLFAKHIKVPEQQELLGKAVVRVGAGTPNRITKLADLEVGNTGSRLKVIVRVIEIGQV